MTEDLKSRLIHYGRTAARVGSELAEVVVHLNGNVNALSIAVVAARAVNTLNDIATPRPSLYFRDWQHVQAGFSKQLLELARGQNVAHMPETQPSKSSGKIWRASLYGVEMGWVEWDGWVDGPWTRSDSDKTIKALGRFVWETLGTSVLIEATAGNDTMKSDSFDDSLPSKTGDDIYDNVRKFNERGHSRSILLYGESGTGKSHIMRHVSRKAGGFSLRVKANQLSDLRDIARAIQLLSPSAVLIDDLDRVENPEKILSELEEINGSSALFMCSANRITKLDPAVLRPGRFDDIIELQKLDEEVINRLIGDVPEPVAAQLRDLPIAWIDEFNKQRDVLGPERAVEEICRLRARAEMIQNLMGEDEKPKAKESASPPTSR